MQSAPDKPNAKYPHVYAILRIDSFQSLEKCATVVKVMAARDQAEEEAARLRDVNEDKECTYIVQTARFVGSPVTS
jgi:predicted DNA-binding ArsR family transcriptional regulator